MKRNERGFTLIELLVAMAVFSSMLVIISVGFINIVHLHNQALNSNVSQDNARTAMDELVRAIRDSTGVVGTPGAGPSGTLCLTSQNGQETIYYVTPAGVLTRASNCTTKTGPASITSSAVNVSNFVATVQSTGPKIVKPVVQVTVTVGTTGNSTGLGAGLNCGTTNASRTFCSVVTLTSGAVPR